jgi:hypothetical protein
MYAGNNAERFTGIFFFGCKTKIILTSLALVASEVKNKSDTYTFEGKFCCLSTFYPLLALLYSFKTHLAF